jgi:hypothetical protein
VLALVAGRRGELRVAALLEGVADASREGPVVSVRSLPAFERARGAVREGLGSEAFERARREGEAMPLDDAVMLARSVAMH